MLSYKDVLTCKVWLGDMRRMYDMADQLGYPYFLWNDRVYKMPDGFNRKEVINTGLTVKDVQ